MEQRRHVPDAQLVDRSAEQPRPTAYGSLAEPRRAASPRHKSKLVAFGTREAKISGSFSFSLAAAPFQEKDPATDIPRPPWGRGSRPRQPADMPLLCLAGCMSLCGWKLGALSQHLEELYASSDRSSDCVRPKLRGPASVGDRGDAKVLSAGLPKLSFN